MDVPVVARGHGRGAVEAADVGDDVGDHAPEAVSDRDHAGAVELRWLDVQQVVGAPVGQVALEHVERGKFASLLDP